MSPIVLLFKSLIPAHTRRLKTGKVINVRQYTDKRTKRLEDDKTLDMFADDTIATPRQELIDEHKRLVDVLESPSRKDDKVEAKKQKEELEGYEGRGEKHPWSDVVYKLYSDGKGFARKEYRYSPINMSTDQLMARYFHSHNFEEIAENKDSASHALSILSKINSTFKMYPESIQDQIKTLAFINALPRVERDKRRQDIISAVDKLQADSGVIDRLHEGLSGIKMKALADMGADRYANRLVRAMYLGNIQLKSDIRQAIESHLVDGPGGHKAIQDFARKQYSDNEPTDDTPQIDAKPAEAKAKPAPKVTAVTRGEDKTAGDEEKADTGDSKEKEPHEMTQAEFVEWRAGNRLGLITRLRNLEKEKQYLQSRIATGNRSGNSRGISKYGVWVDNLTDEINRLKEQVNPVDAGRGVLAASTLKRDTQKHHEAWVKDALDAGLEVPKHVLKDYPWLRPEKPKKAGKAKTPKAKVVTRGDVPALDDDHPAPKMRASTSGLSDQDRARWLSLHQQQHEIHYHDRQKLGDQMDRVRSKRNKAETAMREAEAGLKGIRSAPVPDPGREREFAAAVDKARAEFDQYAKQLDTMASQHEILVEREEALGKQKNAILPGSGDLRMDLMSGSRISLVDEANRVKDYKLRYRDYFKNKPGKTPKVVSVKAA